MKMEFYFDESKLAEEGITKDWALDQIRNFFKACGREAIRETEEGIFVAPISEVAYFAKVCGFRHDEWFINTIGEWYWTDEYTDWKRESVFDMYASINRLKQ